MSGMAWHGMAWQDSVFFTHPRTSPLTVLTNPLTSPLIHPFVPPLLFLLIPLLLPPLPIHLPSRSPLLRYLTMRGDWQCSGNTLKRVYCLRMSTSSRHDKTTSLPHPITLTPNLTNLILTLTLSLSFVP